MLNHLGKIENLSARNKIYTLSDGVTEYGYQPNMPLPLQISLWDQIEVDIELTENLDQFQSENAFLFLRVRSDAKLKIFFNDYQTRIMIQA